MKIEYVCQITLDEHDIRSAAVNGGKTIDLSPGTTRVVIHVAPEVVGESRREEKLPGVGMPTFR